MKRKTKRRIKRTIGIFILFILISATLILFFGISSIPIIIMHETVHQEIYQTYNIDSEIDINYFTLTGLTYPLNDSGKHIQDIDNNSMTEYRAKCNSYCLMSQDFNEIIGYHLIAFTISLWFILIGSMAIWKFINLKIKHKRYKAR